MEVPPKIKMANNTTKVEREVLKVRRKVEFNAASVLDLSSRLGYRRWYSRIRSNTTTVSLMDKGLVDFQGERQQTGEQGEDT